MLIDGGPLGKLEGRDTDRDNNFMSAEEAKDYGIIDAVISKVIANRHATS